MPEPTPSCGVGCPPIALFIEELLVEIATTEGLTFFTISGTVKFCVLLVVKAKLLNY